MSKSSLPASNWSAVKDQKRRKPGSALVIWHHSRCLIYLFRCFKRCFAPLKQVMIDSMATLPWNTGHGNPLPSVNRALCKALWKQCRVFLKSGRFKATVTISADSWLYCCKIFRSHLPLVHRSVEVRQAECQNTRRFDGSGSPKLLSDNPQSAFWKSKEQSVDRCSKDWHLFTVTWRPWMFNHHMPSITQHSHKEPCNLQCESGPGA